MLAMTTTTVSARAPVRARAAALSSRVAAPFTARSAATSKTKLPMSITRAGPEEFSSAPAPSLDAAPAPGGMSKTAQRKAAEKAAKKFPPEAQAPQGAIGREEGGHAPDRG